jgi:hypothetical protein
MKSGVQSKVAILLLVLFAGVRLTRAQEAQPAAGQAVGQEATEPLQAPAYKPRFVGDPAHSEAEAGALGYIRTVLMAQKLYKKKHDSFATSLAGLVHTGSFTQRMTKTDRGDYYVAFQSEGKGKGFNLTLTPKQFDAAHRSFYSDDTGTIRVETDKSATENSDRLR